ncbi:hypothetical protein BDY19DRAFT_455745 [Irpex rosettiformis]|uniref:Uncharacterized protein n=1 Tax=Irpex rosettiformis TaxID=378272 RepID=A0ACB8TTC6_9APHY|nr:hypothetical protein BDY19DRAFT_455745 [Irpex rosettiformis]
MHEHIDESSPASLAATIPPELLNKIVHFVGDEALLYGEDDEDDAEPNAIYFADRQGGMVHLAACSLTCVYWAKVTRRKMFKILVLRSVQDIYDLLSFFHTSHTELYPRGIPSIQQCLQHLVVEHRLGDWVWFDNVRRLLTIQVQHQPYTSLQLDIHVNGGSFTSQSGVRLPSARHPLFRTMPRPLPVPQVSYKSMRLVLKDIHFTDIRGLRNLIQDFNLKSAVWHKEEEWILNRPWTWSTDKIYCYNMTWDAETSPNHELVSSSDMTTVIIGPDGAEFDGPSVFSSGSTDNAIVVMDCLMAALGCTNRRIRPLRIEHYDIIMNMLQSLRDCALRSGLCERFETQMKGSWCYQTPLSLFNLELEFIITARSATSTEEQPLGVESFRFDTICRELLGREQAHEVHEVHIQLKHQHTSSGSLVDVCLQAYNWSEIINSLRQFPQLARISIWGTDREALADFAFRIKELLLPVKDILVLSYYDPVKHESGGIKLESLDPAQIAANERGRPQS